MTNILENIIGKNSKLFYGKVKEDITYKRGSFIRQIIKKELLHSTPIEYKSIEIAHDLLDLSTKITDDNFIINNKSEESDINYYEFEFNAYPNEQIYGTGIQFTHQNLKMKKIPIWVEEQGVGRSSDKTSQLTKLLSISGNEYSSSYAVPYFYSSEGYGILIDTDSFIEFAFNEFKTKCIIHGNFNQIIIAQLDDLYGYIENKALKPYFPTQPKMPKWTKNGIIIGVQGGYNKVMNRIDKLIRSGSKIDAVWIQDWCGKRFTPVARNVLWDYSFKPNYYKNFKEMKSYFKKNNIRLLSYINPFLIVGGNMYKEALNNDFLLKDLVGNPYVFAPITFEAGMVDLTNPDAYSWYRDIMIENMVKMGFDGWMADFGEHFPTNCIWYDKSIDVHDVHHEYVRLWCKLQNDVNNDCENELLIFTRTGYQSTTKYQQLVWGGDKIPNLSRNDGFGSSVNALINGGISGISIMHSDAGGYTTLPWGRRSSILLQRWIEQSIFTPILRTHEGSMPILNSQIYSKEYNLKHFSIMTNVRESLMPYIKDVLDEYYETQLPPIRHMRYYNPEDTNTFEIQYQYYFGKDIIVAPAVEKNFDYYIPKNNDWVNLWDSSKPEAGWHMGLYTGFTPVFYNSKSNHKNTFLKIKDLF